MLQRKVERIIVKHLLEKPNKILIVEGARQVGKSFIIRHIGKDLLKDKFKNYIEINFVEDSLGEKMFANVGNVDDFYFQLSMIAGDRLQKKDNTLIFIDEIQEYPQFLTLLKFLKQDDRFTYICSGSLLGITLSKTTSIPIGSIEILRMYPLDFEEFLLANGFNELAINKIKEKYNKLESLDQNTHETLLKLFKKYLVVGGMPEAVNSFVSTKNITEIRKIQSEIMEFYGDDASKYDKKNKLKIKRIYDLIPSALGNKKKRIVAKDIEDKKGSRFSSYNDEFDYLISSGITLSVKALSAPIFPLIESSGKNLLKLYLNDVGLLTNVLYKNNVNAVLDDKNDINLGSVYESVVASELKAHGFNLFYYDNKKKGEIDFLIDNYDDLSVLPLEIKSGKNYTIHNAITRFINDDDYSVKKGYVFSNNRIVKTKGSIVYLPIYYVSFLRND